MADRRKLQGEIERCLKKVDEGVEIFEDIWKKVLSATNSNQKEKFETDLKKEIKKLQRLRDQIKSWIANSDIKDKSSLLEHRRLIEMQMERFKVVERETKTKAYSKDGLGAAAKLDPQTKEKADATQWISNIIDSLQLQLDQFESELELRAGANKKKGKDSKCEALKEQQERHKFHIETLEKIMRHIDNDKLPVDKMRDLRDDIEYYVESNQDPSFQENTYLYDGLDLEEICTDPPLLASSPVDGEEFLMDRIMSIPSPTNSSSPSPCPNVNANHSNEKNEEIDRKLQKSNSEEKKSISPASLSISRPQSSLHSQNSSSTYSSDSNSINGNHHLSTTPSPLTVFAANEDGQQKISLDSSKPYVNSVDHAATGGLLSNGNLSATTNINSVILASSGNPSVATAPSPQIVTGTVTPPGTSTLSSSALSSINNSSQVHNGLPEVLPVLNGPLSASATIPQKVRSDELSLRTMAQLVIANAELEKTMPLSAPVDSSNVVYSNSSEVLSQSTSSSSLEQCSISLQEQQLSSQLPQQLLQAPQTNTIHLNPLIGMVPLGPMLLAKEQLYQSAMVDACFQHLPHPSDSERLRQFLPRNPCPTPTYYPSASFPHVDNVEIYQRIGTETLFFIFYYMEGTKAQYLAAKALKKQSWRFHTKYMMWFQRFEEPKQITEEFEQGTYIYFDYEKWSRKKKEGFTFEYRYLEDRDLN